VIPTLPPFDARKLTRAYSWARVLNFPEIRDAWPYAAIDSRFDARTEPHCIALDWRSSKTVFSIFDPIWMKMNPPHRGKCFCAVRFFSAADVASMGLSIGKGEDWYGREIEVNLPKVGTVKTFVLPHRLAQKTSSRRGT
jgi:hypothetical protein